MTLGGLALVASLYIYVEKDLPKINSVKDYEPNIPSIIYDRNGVKLRELGKENRSIVKIADVPNRIINSFLAAEDSNFYHHIGIDPLGIARAFIANLKAGRVVQGGSTISQQVAKSFLKSKERSIIRKIKDIFLAYKIEQRLSKSEILFLYLNQVYLGGGYYGIKEAFRGYFGKDLDEVSIAESAMVAGLLVAPSRYSPYSNPKYAYRRQKYVLNRLLADKLISKNEYEDAISESIRYQKRKKREQVGSHFVEFIRKEIVNRLGEDKMLRGGLKVYTTMDSALQIASEKAINDGVLEIDRRQGFVGVRENLSSEEELNDFIQKTQKKFVDKFSEFFVIDKDFRRRLELDSLFEDKLNLLNDQRFISSLEKGNSFKACVTEIKDEEGIVFVNFLGLDGFFTIQDIEWARNRDLKTTKNWKQPLKVISEVLKIGDVIDVVYVGNSLKGLEVNETLRSFLKDQARPFIQLSMFQKPLVQSASITIDPNSGEVYSMVGGNKFFPGYFNRAMQSKRQPGSALKPFVYALALKNGFTNASILYDTPESLSAGVSDFNWKPRNYDGKYMGLITLRKSLELSRNVPTIKLVSKIGVENFISFLNSIGLDGDYNNDLSTSLGSGAISLEKLTLGYSIFVNGGKRKKSKFLLKVTDHHENDYAEIFKDILYKNDDGVIELDAFSDFKLPNDANDQSKNDDIVFDPKNSFLMKSLLQGVIKSGTGKKAKSLGGSLGGKTGTTSDYIDAWFIGFSSKLVTGVWVGFDDNKTLGWPESGSKAALPIWMDIMRNGLKRYPEKDNPLPEGIVNVLIDKETGRLASSGSSNPYFEIFIEGTEPGSSNSGALEVDSREKQPVVDDEFYDLR